MAGIRRRIAIGLTVLGMLVAGACAQGPGLRIDRDADVRPAPGTTATSTPDRGGASAPSTDLTTSDPAREALTPDRGERTATAPPETSTARAPRRTLTLGDDGQAVLEVQRRLRGLGYWLGEPDGSFGELTRQAVLAFQGWEGLTRDGVVGPATREALSAASRPQPTAGGDLIEIHRDRGVLLVVRDGATHLALHTSTGTGERYRQDDGDVAVADTPAGTWEISWQVNGWRESELGRLWRPKYFHEDGIAIHGYPEVPAYPASHGCARVTIEAMNLIWRQGLAPEGSTVVVR